MEKISKKATNNAYNEFLAEIVNLVQSHRVHAIQTVQNINNQLYWNIG